MIPFVKIFNQQINNGAEFIDALNIAFSEMNIWLDSFIQNSEELVKE